jgi:hypothetical protein
MRAQRPKDLEFFLVKGFTVFLGLGIEGFKGLGSGVWVLDFWVESLRVQGFVFGVQGVEYA